MRVGRRHVDRDAYSVEIDHEGRVLRGFVPETLMDDPGLGAPRHAPAYAWLSRNRDRIEAALVALDAGRRPRPPFDLIELAEGRPQ